MGAFRIVGWCVVIGAAAFACGGAASSGDQAPVAQQAIGPAGGTITVRGVTLVIPQGALAGDTAISITDDGVPPPGYVVRGAVYRFQPAGLHFSVPVSVTMPGQAPARMFWTEDGVEDRFGALATTFAANEATAQITHFSSGFVGEAAGADDGGGAPDAGAGDAAGDAGDAASADSGGTCSAGGWPIDAGASATCPASGVIPFCGTCGAQEETFCDTLCPVSGGMMRCYDSKSDPKNCGACGVVCGAGNVCLEGACTPAASAHLVEGLGTPQDVAVDAKNVYFTDKGTGEVWQIDKVTRVGTKLASAQPDPYRLVVDATHVYWTNQGGSVARARIGGATPAEILYPATAPTGIAVDGSNVYWSDGGAIHKGPKAPGCGSASVLSPNAGPDYLAIDDQRVYGMNAGCIGMADPTVFGVDKSAGTTTPYSACAGITTGYFTGFGIDATSVAYIDEKGVGLTLYRADKATGTRTARSLCSGTCTTAPYTSLVVDGCGLYYAVDSSIWRLLPTDTRLRRISSAVSPGARRVAVDATHVYWADVGFIGRVPK
jgi:hypothetical protein